MARIRSLKPEFWHDRKLARSCSRDARMLYMGLWNQADEHGRANGDPAVIKGQIFPYDDVNVSALLSELTVLRRVLPYEVDGDPYLFLPKLAEHQRLDADKVASKHPEPPANIEDLPLQQVTAFPDESGKKTDQTENSAATSTLLYGTGSMGREHGSALLSALNADPNATPQQRAEPITRAYYDALNGMCNWPAVLDIVKRALKSGRWPDQSVADAVLRLAAEGRPLTVDSLRIECDGLPARASPNKATQRIAQGLAVVTELEQERGA